MTDPKKISIADYSYHLPEELIAHYPLTERDASKLLIYRTGNIVEDSYRNIAHYLPENALLIFNNTKVVEARILFRKPTGALIELFCLEPPAEYGGIAAAMAQQGKVRWKCLIGGASKWKPGQVLTKHLEPATGPGESAIRGQSETGKKPEMMPVDEQTAKNESIILEARYISKLEDSFLIELSWQPAQLSFAELLHRAGLIPLPPYIRRAAEQSDSERYQTIYARHDGSVAAPTAGLHFTTAVFQSLAAKNIRQEFVTLHVGAGTFLPVKASTMEQHVMHVEYISVTQAAIRQLLDALGRAAIIPVGTTSARTIESLYWLGVKAFRNPDIIPEDLVLRQWDAYDTEASGNNHAAQKDSHTGQHGGHAEQKGTHPQQQGNQPGQEKSHTGQYGGNPAGQHDGHAKQQDRTSGQQDTNTSGQQGSNASHQESPITPQKALKALLDWLEKQGQPQLLTQTQLLITPGYDWKIAGGLITNFHQPESTLLLLVASLIGKDWKKVYDYALEHQFRFLSYGDGSLLLR